MSYQQVSTNQQVSINMTKLNRGATVPNPRSNRNTVKCKAQSIASTEGSKIIQRSGSFLKRSKSIENRNRFEQQKGNVNELIQAFMFNEYRKNGKTVIATFRRTMDDQDDKKIYRVHKESFQDLFNIIDNTNESENHQICVKIIYYFLDELLEIDEGIDTSDIQNLIERVTKMVNTESRNQILKVFVAFLENTKNETYNTLKKDILACSLYDVNNPSLCKMSYKMMMNHCDHHFFKLAFLLKENLVMEFKVEYKKLLKISQNYFGEFWTYAIKQNAQLLYLMTDAQQLVDTREFLLLNTEGLELKSKITSTFNRVAEFQSVYKALNSSELSLMVKFKIMS